MTIKTVGSFLLGFAMALTALGAHADGMPGNPVHESCQSDYQGVTMYCQGFIVGAMDALAFYSTPSYCRPEGVTYSQGIDVVKRYLEAHPESRHEPAVHLIVAALTEAWPCDGAKR